MPRVFCMLWSNVGMHKSLNNIACEALFMKYSLRENSPYSEFFWSVFSRIWTEYGDLSVFSPNAGQYGPEKLRIRTLFT